MNEIIKFWQQIIIYNDFKHSFFSFFFRNRVSFYEEVNLEISRESNPFKKQWKKFLLKKINGSNVNCNNMIGSRQEKKIIAKYVN